MELDDRIRAPTIGRMKSELAFLPGAEIALPGVEDLQAGRDTVDAAAVLVAATRLRRAGFEVPEGRRRPGEPGHHLFELLVEGEALDPHSRYNAILRRIDSFARALEGAAAR